MTLHTKYPLFSCNKIGLHTDITGRLHMSIQVKKLAFLSAIFSLPIIIMSIYFTSIVYAISSPENATNVRSCSCVAFRLDDVEDYPYSSPLIAVMEVFREKNIDLTIGIVGKNINADNKQVYYYIKHRLDNSSTNNGNDSGADIEIANHSWEHERFLNLTFHQQINSIRKTNEKIKDLFGFTPTLFIPPYDELNNDTILAMLENNIRFVSADERDSSISSNHLNNTIYHLPETAETGCDCRVTKGYFWQGIDHEETLRQIKTSMKQNGFAIVVMHPMEYSLEHDSTIFQNALDSKQIRELEFLIEKIKLEGFHIVTVGNIIRDNG